MGECGEFDWPAVFAGVFGCGLGLITLADQRDLLEILQARGIVREVFYVCDLTFILSNFD
jgi:hypothetical protein